MARTCEICGCEIPDDMSGSSCPACELRSAFSSVDDLEGKSIGRYTITSRIGTGGFGVVYLAHQSEPVKRNVALKILKRDRISEATVAQFVAEQQALAVLNHPNIAKIFDAGETDWGAPYFVMELIEGEPITLYCDRKRLTPNERILVFREICAAIQHAHQKAIIHRDIKPSNILVVEHEDRPVPKIIDFGVAKAMGTPLTEALSDLPALPVIGTPEYMPPEQARGDGDIDTRADIYSLGVLLYELLIGTPPFSRKQFHEAGMEAIIKMIEEDRPPSPSERLESMADRGQTVAQNRHVETPELKRMIRGDLDWIVMKAIEKTRKWRYQSATAMAQDIDLYLEGRPLATRRASILYSARKFCRRNKALVSTAAAAVLIASVSAAIASSVLAKQKRDQAIGLLESLFDCRVERLPAVVAAIDDHAARLDDRLQETAESEDEPEAVRARARLALLERHPEELSSLMDWLLEAPPGELGVYLGMLEGYEQQLARQAWSAITDENAPQLTRLHAAAIGASADPTDGRWTNLADQVAGWLVEAGAFGAARWLPLLQPMGERLAPALQDIYRRDQDSATGETVAFVLAELYADDLDSLTDLVRSGGPRQLPVVADVLARDADEVEGRFAAELRSPLPEDTTEQSDLVQERARLAIALLLIRRPDAVWPLLEHQENPDLRSALIHQVGEFRTDWELLVDEIANDRSPGVMAAIPMALARFDTAQLAPTLRSERILPRLEQLYSQHSNVGVRSAAEWLLRRWDLQVDFAALDRQNSGGEPIEGKNWYVTSGGDFTMAILPAPAEFVMGSPKKEIEDAFEIPSHRPEDEKQQKQAISISFAIST